MEYNGDNYNNTTIRIMIGVTIMLMKVFVWYRTNGTFGSPTCDGGLVGQHVLFSIAQPFPGCCFLLSFHDASAGTADQTLLLWLHFWAQNAVECTPKGSPCITLSHIESHQITYINPIHYPIKSHVLMGPCWVEIARWSLPPLSPESLRSLRSEVFHGHVEILKRGLRNTETM